MTEQLKPCPFCGRSATIRGDFGLEQLACSDPAGDCPASDFGIPAHTPHRRAVAIEAWNRRAQPAQAVPMTDEQADDILLSCMPLTNPHRLIRATEKFHGIVGKEGA